MNDELKAIRQEIEKYTREFIVQTINNEFTAHKEFIDKIKQTYTDFRENLNSPLEKLTPELIDSVHQYNLNLYNIIQHKYQTSISVNFDEKFPGYTQAVNSFIDSLENSVRLSQNLDRFSSLKNDPLLIRFLKKIKRVFLILSQTPIWLGNLFRKLIKKEIKTERVWHQIVPLKQLTLFFLRDGFTEKILPILNAYYAKECEIYLGVWKLDEKLVHEFFNHQFFNHQFEEESAGALEFSNIEEDLIRLEKTLNEHNQFFIDEIFTALNEVYLSFQESFQLAGTIELPRRLFSSKKINKKHKYLNEIFYKENHAWNNTFFAMFEDWRLNKEVYSSVVNYSQIHLTLIGTINKAVNDLILPKVNQIGAQLEKIETGIEGYTGTPPNFINYLENKRVTLREKLINEIIPITIETIFSQNIPTIVDEFEISVRNRIDDISKKRAITQDSEYNKGLKDSELDFISPKELIIFDKLPNFLTEILLIKNKIVVELEQIQNLIRGINEVADFNLESAIAVFEEQTGDLEYKARKIAIEGINRAFSKIDEIKSGMLSIINFVEKDLNKALISFKEDIFELTINEKIFNIKIKLAKAKAVNKAKTLRKNIIDRLKSTLPLLSIRVNKIINKSKTIIDINKKRLGLTKPKEYISSDISDYLTETQAAIQMLPFVYQRLFQVEALDEERFFYGREDELGRLNNYFIKWQKGFFAPVAIVGEKGSGITTFLNIFLKKLVTNLQIRRTVLNNNIHSAKDFLSFMNALLENDTFIDLEAIINHLNNLPAKQIVIIENLQQMFLMKVDGFRSLEMLLELISRTNQNVFWITSTTYYGWTYLDKTINIADQHGYIIKLQNLKDDEMVEIINKRHRVSGYKIVFEEYPEEFQTKAFKKLDGPERQAYLKKQYFSNLNKFAGSNISLALLYWLRSTTEVTQDTIIIKSQVNADYSFLESLSFEKLFTLKAIVLHDGLTEDSHKAIFGATFSQSRRMLSVLFNDGVLIKKKEVYTINPQLYRQAVNLLKSKNILH